MAFLGPGTAVAVERPLFFALYWGVFLVLFLGAVYSVLLDIRYIRLQYHLAQRQLVLETLKDEALQQALNKAANGAEPHEDADDAE